MHEESRDLGYGAALSGGDNPSAPFNLKKDWEITRWAKLRRLRSTAFSDLLAINGVCFSSFFLWFSYITILRHIYLTGPWGPQLVIQELKWTQPNHRHQVTWMATIQTSGSRTEWWSLGVLCTRYHRVPSCSVGRPRFWGWPYSWARMTLYRSKHDDPDLSWDEHGKVVVGYPGNNLIDFILLFMLTRCL